MRFVYKYLQTEYPYARLLEENQNRHGFGPEFELLDTGAFDADRYFDIFIEYAKITPEDIAIRIQAFNRGPAQATLHILPHLWFRNTWSWGPVPGPEPVIQAGPRARGKLSLVADHARVPIPPPHPGA